MGQLRLPRTIRIVLIPSTLYFLCGAFESLTGLIGVIWAGAELGTGPSSLASLTQTLAIARVLMVYISLGRVGLIASLSR